MTPTHPSPPMTPISWTQTLAVVLGAALLVAFTNLVVFVFFSFPPAMAIPWIILIGALFLGWHLRSAGRPPRQVAGPLGSPVPLGLRLRLRRPRRSGWWLAGMVLSTLVFMFGVAQIIQLATGPIELGDAPFFRSVMTYVEDPLGWAAFALAAAVVIPLVEEFAFRGRMQGHLEVAWGGPVGAVLATSALFAVMHAGGPHPLLLVVPFLMGIFCGAAVILTRSIWSGVLLHGIWNGLMTLGTRTTGMEEAIPDPAEVSPTATLIWSVAMILLGTAGWIQLARPAPEGSPPHL